MLKRFFILLAMVSVLIAGCSRKDPGPLAGTWKTSLGTIVEFREGKSVADGVASNVTYRISGNRVKVVRKDGSSATYTLKDADSATTGYMALHRVK